MDLIPRRVRWAAALALAAAACGPAPPAPKPAEPSPARTLYRFKLAYNTPDPKLLADSLTPAGFGVEAEEPVPGMPARWGYDEEVAASRELFARAYHVVLDFTATDAAVGKPTPGALSFSTRSMDVTLRVWRDANYCFYAQGPVTFRLTRPAPAASWRIAGWRDGTGPAHADAVANAETRLSSWTEVKLYYWNLGCEENE